MKEKRKKIMAVAVVFLLSMLFYHAIDRSIDATNIVSLSLPKTIVHVQSIAQPITTNDINISITITNVTDLRSFSLHVNYNSSLLRVVNAVDGGFLRQGQFSYNDKPPDLFAMSSGSGSVNGSGTLVVATFHCVNEDKACNTDLTLHDVKLHDSQDLLIDNLIENGRYEQEAMFNVPMVLDRNYTLPCDMSSEGGAFEVIASNIVIDLNGHSIASTGQLGAAVEIYDEHNVSIRNGKLVGFQRGVRMQNCSNVSIINTQILSSQPIGIEVIRSNYVQIVGNVIGNQLKGEAIDLETSDYANIKNNTISNSFEAIQMVNSNNNNISENQIAYNTYQGIYMSNCVQNKFWSNDFIDNARQLRSFSSANNTWDLGYLFGNYWGDYAGVDNVSGQNHAPGPDGIGDTPYVISGYQDNIDNYPLKNPHGQKLQMFEASGHTVAIFSDAFEISAFDFNRTAIDKISFNVTGGTFCKAIIPKKLFDGAIETQVDGTPVASLLSLDDSYMFTNVTYKSAHQIQIGGEFVERTFGWKPEDVNADGKVDIVDVTLVAKAYGQKAHP